ncbi:MAG: glycosyltransferase family protein [Opitutaceae bacterium]|nr:glycosyltransferase family protein [Opitutaceae bacterium]
MPAPAARHQLLIAEGRAAFDHGNFTAAREAFAAATSAQPDCPEALARLAETCGVLGDHPAAAQHWSSVLVLRPGLAVAYTGLALTLRAIGRLEDATAQFERAVAANPALAETPLHSRHLPALGRPGQAATVFREALRLDPAHSGARFNLSLALFKGDFKTGALAYEARWKAEWRGRERPFSGPRWTGRPLPSGQSLLLWGEQGIGDEIMFAGLIPAAIQAAAGPCLVECAPRLVPLFARSFPLAHIVPRADPPSPALPLAAAQAPLGALPGLLWPAGAPPVAPNHYLQADPATKAQLRTRLDLLGAGPKIGIAWRGGHPAAGRPRVIPAPAWAPLFAHPDLVVINLQHGATAEETAALASAGGRLHTLADIDPLRDMDTFAALVGSLDAIVAVDNSTIHLAAALGRPTAVLLAQDSDWRWGVDGTPCPWYPSLTRLRQSKADDWAAPIQAALDFLAALPPCRP